MSKKIYFGRRDVDISDISVTLLSKITYRMKNMVEAEMAIFKSV